MNAFSHRFGCIGAVVAASLLAVTGSGQAVPIWPVPGPVIAEFDPPDPDWLPGHRGIDLPAVAGTVIRSPRDGVVQFAGSVAGTPVVVVSHGVVAATYLPATTPLAVGEDIAAASPFARVQDGDHCAVSCLHWGARANGRYVDPRILLGDYEVVLRPGTD